MRVDVRSSLKRPAYPAARAGRFLNRALSVSGERRRAREISVFFCGDSAMRRLNRTFRDKDRTTDVLSFPASAGGDGDFLGDLIVSVPEVRRQARASSCRFDRVMEKLLLHGLLHLLGYDHETEAGEMDSLEARLRRRLSTAP